MTFTDRCIERAEWGHRYTRALSLMEQTTWFELMEIYKAGDLGDVESLVLIHPEWYDGARQRPQNCPIRGGATFGLLPTKGQICQSDFIWGYSCPLTSRDLHCDHVFPWSLGGPTVPENAVWLCESHNRAKGADWHLTAAPISGLRWFTETLQRIERLV